jgi:hypothetical protein
MRTFGSWRYLLLLLLLVLDLWSTYLFNESCVIVCVYLHLFNIVKSTKNYLLLYVYASICVDLFSMIPWSKPNPFATKVCSISLFVWLVADGWCWFVLTEKYCWLVTGGWFVLREKYCWLVADKSNEQGASPNLAPYLFLVELSLIGGIRQFWFFYQGR